MAAGGYAAGMVSPFDDAPRAVLALVPEATSVGAGEARADCAACPLVASGAPHPWGFAAETRCCTYHPSVPNFLVGRALARGGGGAERMRARLGEPEGVSATGVDAPPARDRLYQLRGAHAFGRERALRCPFWQGGEHSCGVWADRPATCRTWFCKHDDGLGAAATWSQLGILVSEAEARVAALLVARGRPPAADGTDPSAWATWFTWCADEVERLTADDLAPLASAALEQRRAAWRAMQARPARPLAAVLVPSVSELVRDGARVWLTGYSSYDGVAAPPSVFALLAALDGATPWTAALAAARTATGDERLDEALVIELHRVGALSAADGSDALPFEVVPVRGAAWSHAAVRPR